MHSAPLWMWPWAAAWQSFQLPWSGDVTQNISPITTWFPLNIDVDYPGNPKVEVEVLSRVASVGKQLGRITEALLAVAEATSCTELKEIEALREIARQVDEIKQARRPLAVAEATAALQIVRSEDPAGYAAILEKLSLVEAGFPPGP